MFSVFTSELFVIHTLAALKVNSTKHVSVKIHTWFTHKISISLQLTFFRVEINGIFFILINLMGVCSELFFITDVNFYEVFFVLDA